MTHSFPTLVLPTSPASSPFSDAYTLISAKPSLSTIPQRFHYLQKTLYGGSFCSLLLEYSFLLCLANVYLTFHFQLWSLTLGDFTDIQTPVLELGASSLHIYFQFPRVEYIITHTTVLIVVYFSVFSVRPWWSRCVLEDKNFISFLYSYYPADD